MGGTLSLREMDFAEGLAMHVQYRELERSIREISTRVGRTRRTLTPPGSPSPGCYLSSIRAVRALRDAWNRHLEIEHDVFPCMISLDLYSMGPLKKVSEDHEALSRRLNELVDAPWPRSADAGIKSIRVGIREVLSQLLVQIERERIAILPVVRRIARTEESEMKAAM